MAARPQVSVVTPFYNTAAYLAECIQSVLAQSHTDFEYLLVNNRSTDRSREIAADYAARDSRIRLIDNDAFVGQVENYNGALARISPASKYVKMVQADDTIGPRCLELMVALAERAPRVGVVSSFWTMGEVQGSGVERGVETLSGRDACRRMLLDNCFLLGSPTSVLYRADLVRARQPFFATGRYHEDTEAAFELLLEHDFGFVHEVLSFLRTDNVSITSSTRDLNSDDLDYLILLERFGPMLLSPEELRRQRALSHGGYFQFLGRAVLRLRGKRFWDYHRKGLATVGWKLRARDVGPQAAAELVRMLRHPRDTLQKALVDVRKRLGGKPARPLT